MIDASQGIESQDINIFQLADRNHKGIVIVVNKWDLIEKDTHSVKQFTQMIHEKIAPFTDVPIIFTSVVNKQRLLKVLEIANDVHTRRSFRITTSKLNDLMLPEIENYPPPSYKDKYIRIKYITQLPLAYPAFAFFCNLPQYIRSPYKRFIENKLRSHFDLSGVPIEIFFREK
jgi:GTP-binding protein